MNSICYQFRGKSNILLFGQKLENEPTIGVAQTFPTFEQANLPSKRPMWAPHSKQYTSPVSVLLLFFSLILIALWQSEFIFILDEWLRLILDFEVVDDAFKP